MKELKLRHYDGKYMQYSRDFESLYDYINHFKEFEKEELLFTGLIDKNGVEIYEGDILKLYTDQPWNTIGEVNLDECELSVTGSICEIYATCWNVNGYAIEGHSYKLVIIGNIYENKELLQP